MSRIGAERDRAATDRVAAVLRDDAALLAAHDEDAAANFARVAAMRGRAAQAYAKWKAEVARVVDLERPGGVRFQMQTPLVGRSLLTVLSTARYDAVIQRALDPAHGLTADWRRARSSPLALPDSMQQVGAVGSMIVINELLRYVYAAHAALRAGRAFDVAVEPLGDVLAREGIEAPRLDAFVRHIHANWAVYRLPEVRAEVRLLQPEAQPGDVLVWTSFHGSAAVVGRPRPHLVMFHDFIPRDTLDAATRGKLFRVQSKRPVEFGSGNKATRSEAWNVVYNQRRGTPGGLERMAVRPLLADYLAGSDDVEPGVVRTALPAVLTEDQRAQLERDGYLVVPRAALDAASDGAWSRSVDAVIVQVQDFFNWALFEEQGMAGTRALRLFGDAGPGSPQPPDDRWKALADGKSAREHFGDALWLRLRLPDGSKSGTAQGGGTRLAGDSGMGPALNAYDLPAQQELRYSPALYALAAALYGDRRLMAVPERFRLKVAAKPFKVHTDRLIEPIGAPVDVARLELATVGDGVFLAESTLPGAGLGLFADRDFRPGQPITEYYGRVFRDDVRRGDKLEHAIELAAGWSIDGTRTADGTRLTEPGRQLAALGAGGGAYANDLDFPGATEPAPPGARTNARFVRTMDNETKARLDRGEPVGADEVAIFLEATELIPAGSEIFANYALAAYVTEKRPLQRRKASAPKKFVGAEAPCVACGVATAQGAVVGRATHVRPLCGPPCALVCIGDELANLRAAERGLAEASAEHQRLITEAQEQATVVDEAQRTLAAERASVIAQTEQFRAWTAGVEPGVSAARAARDALVTEREGLLRQIADYRDWIAALETRIVDVERSMAARDAEVAPLTEQMAQYRAHITRLRAALQAREAAVMRLVGQLGAMRASEELAAQRVAALSRTVTKLQRATAGRDDESAVRAQRTRYTAPDGGPDAAEPLFARAQRLFRFEEAPVGPATMEM
jgi:hypothetical protein